ncbi:hypothetical protein [Streptomyces sp. NPDC002676]
MTITAFPVDREPANARPGGFNQLRAAGYANIAAGLREMSCEPFRRPLDLLNLTCSATIQDHETLQQPWRPSARYLYRWVARNRHRLPGGTTACPLPASHT